MFLSPSKRMWILRQRMHLDSPNQINPWHRLQILFACIYLISLYVFSIIWKFKERNAFSTRKHEVYCLSVNDLEVRKMKCMLLL